MQNYKELLEEQLPGAGSSSASIVTWASIPRAPKRQARICTSLPINKRNSGLWLSSDTEGWMKHSVWTGSCSLSHWGLWVTCWYNQAYSNIGIVLFLQVSKIYWPHSIVAEILSEGTKLWSEKRAFDIDRVGRKMYNSHLPFFAEQFHVCEKIHHKQARVKSICISKVTRDRNTWLIQTWFLFKKEIIKMCLNKVLPLLHDKKEIRGALFSSTCWSWNGKL